MRKLVKITFASWGLGLTVLLAGGSKTDKSTMPQLSAEKAKVEPAKYRINSSAKISQGNDVATGLFSNSLAVSICGPVDERRQQMLDRLQKISR
jgi:hypothetical protein